MAHWGLGGWGGGGNLPANVEDVGLSPGSGRSLGERNSKPTPLFLPGKSHGQRAWWATVHGVTKELDMT